MSDEPLSSSDEERPRLLPARLAVLLGVGWVLLTPPILGLFAQPSAVFGIPVLVVYVFGAWLALIACIAWLVETAPES